MLLYLYSIYYFILPLELFLSRIIKISIIIIVFIILWHSRKIKFEISPIQLHVDQLVDKLTNNFPMSTSQVLYLYIIYVWKAKLFEIGNHFIECIVYLALMVFVVDEYALFFVLKTSYIRNMIYLQ